MKKFLLTALVLLWSASSSRAVTGNYAPLIVLPAGSVVYGSSNGIPLSSSTVSVDTTTLQLKVKDIQISGTCTGSGCGAGSTIPPIGVAYGSSSGSVTSDPGNFSYSASSAEVQLGTSTNLSTTNDRLMLIGGTDFSQTNLINFWYPSYTNEPRLGLGWLDGPDQLLLGGFYYDILSQGFTWWGAGAGPYPSMVLMTASAPQGGGTMMSVGGNSNYGGNYSASPNADLYLYDSSQNGRTMFQIYGNNSGKAIDYSANLGVGNRQDAFWVDNTGGVYSISGATFTTVDVSSLTSSFITGTNSVGKIIASSATTVIANLSSSLYSVQQATGALSISISNVGSATGTINTALYNTQQATGTILSSVNALTAQVSTAAYINKANTFSSSQTITAPGGVGVTYNLNVGTMTGAGLTNCGDTSHALSWTNGLYGCQALATGGGGGGASTLAVATGSVGGFGVPASSPTSAIVFDSSTFMVQLTGTSTGFVRTNGSSVTLQGNAVSLSALNTGVYNLGIATGSILGNVSSIGAATGTINTAVYNVSQATGTLAYNVGQATGTMLGSISSIGTATGTMNAALYSTQQTTGTLAYNVGQATGTLAYNVGQATGTNLSLIKAVGVSTGTLAYGVGQATGTILSNLNAVTAQISTAAYVNLANTFSSSQTITSAGGLGVSYGITAASVTTTSPGDGEIDFGRGGYTYYAVSSSAPANNTTSHLAVWSGTTTLVDGGPVPTSGGGGASTLAVATGSVSGFGVPASSPTTAIVGDSSTFNIQLIGASTAFMSLNPSSVTLQGNAISLSALNTGVYNVGLATGVILSSANALTAQVSSAAYINQANTFSSSQTIVGTVSVVALTFSTSPIKTGNYTAICTDSVLLSSAAGPSSVVWSTVTLPAASACPGHQITIWKVDSSTQPTVLMANPGDVINGTGTLTFFAPSQGCDKLVSDGVNSWRGLCYQNPAIIGNLLTAQTAVALSASSSTISIGVYNPSPAMVCGYRFSIGTSGGGSCSPGVTTGGCMNLITYDAFGNIIESTGPVSDATTSFQNLLTTPFFVPQGSLLLALQANNTTFKYVPIYGATQVNFSGYYQTSTSMTPPSPLSLATTLVQPPDISLLTCGGPWTK